MEKPINSDLWPWSFGETMKLIRLMQRLSLDDVADQIQRNQSYLSAIERDKAEPSPKFLSDMSKIYGCPWWAETQRVEWLHGFAWIMGNRQVRMPVAPQIETLKQHMSTALSIVDTLARVTQKSYEVSTRYALMMSEVGLPDITQLALHEHATAWAWLIETFDVAPWSVAEGDEVAKSRELLNQIDAGIRQSGVSPRMEDVARAVQRLRMERQWSHEELAHRANEQLREVLGWPSAEMAQRNLKPTDIVRMEEGSYRPSDWVDYAIIALAFDVSLSNLLEGDVKASPERGQASESDVMDVLRRHGLDDAARAVIQSLLPYLTKQNDGSNGPK